MGRIAEALKRAERDRGRADGVSPETASGVVSACKASETTRTVEPLTPSKREPPERQIGLVDGLAESIVSVYEPSSLITEQYRSLRTRLLSQNPHYEHRVIAVTSAVPKEGKSVTTLNLGCILAEIHHLKILVVDGDFRRSSLAQMLNQPQGPGLAELLTGEVPYEEVLCDTPVPNLSFMPAGSTRKHSAAELLTQACAKPAFKRMQNSFHYTIVDTPPATTVTDVGIIGQMCTGVMMVVRLNRTHEAAAKRAVRLLEANNIPIVGCVVVGRDLPVDGYGYGYGYGRGNRSNYSRYYDYIKE